MRTVRKAVEIALARNPIARDDNRVLYLEVLKQQGISIPPELEATVGSWPQIETVRRVRAKIQNEEGQLLPSPHVRAQRQAPVGRPRSTP